MGRGGAEAEEIMKRGKQVDGTTERKRDEEKEKKWRKGRG